MNIPLDIIRTVTTHEMGHYVVGRKLGLTVVMIDAFGLIDPVKFKLTGAVVWRSPIPPAVRAVCAIAGVVAERMFCESARFTFYGHPLTSAAMNLRPVPADADLSRGAEPGFAGDFWAFVTMAKELGRLRDVDTFLAECEAAATVILKGESGELEQLAAMAGYQCLQAGVHRRVPPGGVVGDGPHLQRKYDGKTITTMAEFLDAWKRKTLH